jgi:hypothetical protein
MSTISRTSELEAVNTMLDAIGESPVSSLEVSGLVDVAKAKSALDEISREVQAKGWHFNTETDYPLPVSLDGTITLPSNFLSVDTVGAQRHLDVVQRGSRLYDKKNHTYIFTESIKADVTLLLEWEELPQVARHYIMIRASRVFQSRVLGSAEQFQFSAQQEQDALIALNESEGETGDYNMLTGSYSVASILER